VKQVTCQIREIHAIFNYLISKRKLVDLNFSGRISGISAVAAVGFPNPGRGPGPLPGRQRAPRWHELGRQDMKKGPLPGLS